MMAASSLRLPHFVRSAPRAVNGLQSKLAFSSDANALENFTFEVKDGVAIVTMDMPGASVNTLSSSMTQEFNTVLDKIESTPDVKSAILRSAKKNNFIAGADITQLAKCETEADAFDLVQGGQKIMDRLEGLSKPVVAAIDGSCLGGGLEVAMACKYRIASTNSKTSLGLPEVQLGLLPGAGGTQRLPKLVGAQQGIKMCLTGAPLKAEKAKRAGLVHQVADPNALMDAAMQAAKGLADGSVKASRKKQPLPMRLMENNPIGREIMFNIATKETLKKTGGNYPNAPLILDCIKTGMAEGHKAGSLKEAKHFSKLAKSKEAESLMGIFFGTTKLKKSRFGKPEKPVNTIGVLGAGLMGAGIGQVSAAKGMRVLLKDLAAPALARGEKQISGNMASKVKRRSMSQFEVDRMMAQVVGMTNDDPWQQHFKGADMVVEAVLEELSLKHRVMAEIEAVVSDDCVFATNTSAIPIKDIAAGSKRPENVIGMHYFSPVDKMPLLEIITHEGTSNETAAKAVDVGLRQGKTVIVVKDVPGFYVNRSLGPYMAETLALLKEGVSPDAMNSAMTKFGFPVGPITLCDEVGIDVLMHVHETLSADLGERMLGGDSTLMQGMSDAGMLGKKTGKGFYAYSGPKLKRGPNAEADALLRAYVTPGAKPPSTEDVQLRMNNRFVNEAVMCLQDGIIASPVDGDIGAVFGIGFPPFRGGPFRYVDSIGAQTFVDQMYRFRDANGPQFEPAQMLKDLAASGGKFHSK